MPSLPLSFDVARAVFKFNSHGFPILKQELVQCLLDFINAKNPSNKLIYSNVGFMYGEVSMKEPRLSTFTLTHKPPAGGELDDDSIIELADNVISNNPRTSRLARMQFYKNMSIFIVIKDEVTKKIAEDIREGLKKCAETIIVENAKKDTELQDASNLRNVESMLERTDKPEIPGPASKLVKEYLKGGKNTRKRKSHRSRKTKHRRSR